MNRAKVVILATVAAIAAATLFATSAAGQGVPPDGPAVIEGTVLMAVEDDFARGKAKKRYFLDQAGGKQKHELKLTAQQADALRPGMKVRASGNLAGGVLSADGTGGGVTILEAPAGAAQPTAVRKVLILLVDITDSGNVTHRVGAMCDGTVDAVAAGTFGFNTTAANVDGCYQDSSFGLLGVGGASYPGTDVDVQRVTISDAVTSCNYTSWGSKADAKAANLANYQHRVYVVPDDANCGWAGLAYVNSCPGSYCQAWVKAYGGQPCGYLDAIAHEVGHNLGLMHASTDLNNDAALDCEYCDDSDFMGYAEANLRPLNGPHRVQMGWVSGGGVIDASGGGQFTLSPLNLRAAPLPQVARIVTPNGDPYYLSYRVGIGYDTLLSSTFYSPGLVGELSIHRWPGGVTNTRFIASLGTGESLPDAANGLTIIKNSDNGSSLTLTVAIGIQPPTNLKATAGDSQVALSWTASAGATGYNIKRATTSGGSYSGIAFGVPATSFLDTPLINGQTYYYVVSAVGSGGASVDSAQVSATPNGVDLQVTTVSNPPASAAPGASFTATDTVKNNGLIAAGASTTRFYLSTDAFKDGGDVLLAASRAVASLAAGQTSSGNTTVTIPSNVAGAFYLLACADDLSAVTETNETNNCRASATAVQITRPDLAVTALGIPTAPVAPGGTFKVTDTVKNQGTVAAGAFTTRYYLSLNSTKDIVVGSRSVSSLSAGQTSNGNLNVTVPSGTSPGAYYVVSCADDSNTVVETDEANNCRVSASTIQVALPDLVITAVGNPPASAAKGAKFRITDTTKNQGTVTATASATRYYLSTDQQKGGGDVLLSGTRSVSSLNAGQSASGNVNVTIPATTPAGTYYVVACADDAGAVTEGDETNNCKGSAGTVVVP